MRIHCIRFEVQASNAGILRAHLFSRRIILLHQKEKILDKAAQEMAGRNHRSTKQDQINEEQLAGFEQFVE